MVWIATLIAIALGALFWLALATALVVSILLRLL
jgi:hypothetical protein